MTRAYGKRQLSRRSIIGAAIVGGTGIGTASAGCSGKGNRGAAPAAEHAQRGGNFIHGARANYFLFGTAEFDPNKLTSTYGRFYSLFYQSVVGFDLQTFAPVPELARSWEQPSPTEYVFKLQPGVKWQNTAPVNGRELTTGDIVSSLNRAHTDNPAFASKTLTDTIDTIEAIDNDSVRITTNTVDAAFLAKLGSGTLAILAPEVLQKYDKLSRVESAVGTGPFILKSAEPGVGAELERNPEYWKPGRPYLDRIRFPSFNDDEQTYAAFLAGQVHVSPVPGELLKDYLGRGSPGFSPVWFAAAGGTLYGLTRPNTKVMPFSDPRTWKALRLLLDHAEVRSAFTEVLYGRGKYGSLLASPFDQWDLSEQEYTSHSEWKQSKDEATKQAIQFLSAAGYDSTKPLEFEMVTADFPNHKDHLAPLYQDQWRRLSGGVIRTSLKFVQSLVLPDLLRQGRFVYALDTSGAVINDPDLPLSQSYSSRGVLNTGGWSDPQADAMIDQQRRTLDVKERRSIIRELLVYMIDNSPFTEADKLYWTAAQKPQVHDWIPDAGGFQGRQYDSVWLSG